MADPPPSRLPPRETREFVRRARTSAWYRQLEAWANRAPAFLPGDVAGRFQEASRCLKGLADAGFDPDRIRRPPPPEGLRQAFLLYGFAETVLELAWRLPGVVRQGLDICLDLVLGLGWEQRVSSLVQKAGGRAKGAPALRPACNAPRRPLH